MKLNKWNYKENNINDLNQIHTESILCNAGTSSRLSTEYETASWNIFVTVVQLIECFISVAITMSYPVATAKQFVLLADLKPCQGNMEFLCLLCVTGPKQTNK